MNLGIRHQDTRHQCELSQVPSERSEQTFAAEFATIGKRASIDAVHSVRKKFGGDFEKQEFVRAELKPYFAVKRSFAYWKSRSRSAGAEIDLNDLPLEFLLASNRQRFFLPVPEIAGGFNHLYATDEDVRFLSESPLIVSDGNEPYTPREFYSGRMLLVLKYVKFS